MLPSTYQSVIDTAVSWLENNCINSYTKWGSCPVWCKSGYRTNWVYFAGENVGNKGAKFRYVLQNGLSAGLSQYYIKNQLESFITGQQADRARYIPEGELLDFMLDLGKFFAAHVYFFGAFNSDDPNDVHNGTARVSRTKNTQTYLVYKDGTPTDVLNLSGLNEYKVTEAADINRIIETIMIADQSHRAINDTNRCISAQYTIELAST